MKASGCCCCCLSVRVIKSRRSFQADQFVVSFSFVLLARRLMLSVDVDELEDLKYEYKGA